MIVVKRAEISDVDQIACIEKECFLDAWSEKSITECIKSNRYEIFVAKDNEKVLGYAGLLISEDLADVTRIAVLSVYRKKGIGRKLFSSMFSRVLELKLNVLLLEVRADNEGAIALYESFDGERYGVRKNYYGGGVDGLLYRFTVGGKPLGI